MLWLQESMKYFLFLQQIPQQAIIYRFDNNELSLELVFTNYRTVHRFNLCDKALSCP
jgi:hypothetical protein